MSIEPGQWLGDTMTQPELPKLAAQLSKSLLDGIDWHLALDSVGVGQTALALMRQFRRLIDYRFERKVVTLLVDVSTLSAGERAGLIERLERDTRFGERAGERLLEWLSRLDGPRKVHLLAAALAMYARCEITDDQLRRLANAIERFLLCDADALKPFCAAGAEPRPTDGDPATVNILNSGLGYVESGYGAGGVRPTETAGLFLRILDAQRVAGS